MLPEQVTPIPDIEANFIAARCERGYNHRVQSQVLYDAYLKWCEENEVWRKPMNKVTREWKRLGLNHGATNGVHYWYGVRLIEAD